MKHKQTQSATHNSAPTAATARYVADAERVRIALSLPTPLDEPPPSYVVTDSVPSRDNDGITIIHEEEPDERPPSYEMSVEGRERPVSCDDEVF